MSQISPPIRILLVAVIGLCAVYMLFLKPKGDATTPVAAPAAATTPIPAEDPNAKTQSKPGAIVQGAVRDTQAASARSVQAAGSGLGVNDGTTNGPASTGVNTNPVTKAPATGQTAAPTAVTKAQLATLPRDVRRAVVRRKVLALLFYNNRSADDVAVRRELAHVNHYGGQVFVAAHWIKNVARYQAITRGVDVEQSPTIVIADSNLKADTLVGYVDRDTIDQAVVDALRASGGSLIKNPYYRQLDAICSSTKQQITALQQPSSAAAVPAYLTGVSGIMADTQRKTNAVKAPHKYARFQKSFRVYVDGNVSLINRAVTRAKTKGTGAFRTVSAQTKRMDRTFVRKHGAHGLSCFGG